MPRLARLLLLVFVTLVVTNAMAGSLNKKGVYTSSHGYSLTPPEDWQVVDRGNFALVEDKLPESVLRADKATYDVFFVRQDVDEPDEGAPPGIHDSLVVLVVPSTAKADSELSNAVAVNVQAELAKIFAEVELLNSGPATHGGNEGIDFEWKVSDPDGALSGFVLQTLLPGSSRSIMITCSVAEARYEETKKLCLETFDSVKLND